MKNAIRWSSLGLVLALTLILAGPVNAEETKNVKDEGVNQASVHNKQASVHNKTAKGWKKGKKKGFKGKDEPKGLEKKEATDPPIGN